MALVRDALPARAGLLDLGEHRLKDLQRPERVFQLTAPGLPGDFPALRTLDALPPQPAPAADQLRGAGAGAGGGRAAPGHHPPADPHRHRGHRQDPPGPAGGGGGHRGRTPTASGSSTWPRWPRGRWCPTPPSPPWARRGGRTGPGRRRPGWWRTCAPGGPCCCWTTASTSWRPAARLADAVLRGCPGVRVLATSRELLGVAGETAWRVPSLGLPDPDAAPGAAALEASGAGRLFLERARAAQPAFALTDANAGAVAEVCRPPGRDPPGPGAGRRAGAGADPGAARGAPGRPLPAADRGRAHRPAPAADPAGHRGLVPRPARRAGAGPVPAPGRLPRGRDGRLPPGGGRGRGRRRRRRPGGGGRGPGPAHGAGGQVAGAGRGPRGRGALPAAGDAAPVRRGAAAAGGGGRRRARPPRRLVPRPGARRRRRGGGRRAPLRQPGRAGGCATSGRTSAPRSPGGPPTPRPPPPAWSCSPTPGEMGVGETGSESRRWLETVPGAGARAHRRRAPGACSPSTTSCAGSTSSPAPAAAAREAREIFEALGDADGAAEAASHEGLVAANLGDYDRGAALLGAALARARERGDWARVEQLRARPGGGRPRPGGPRRRPARASRRAARWRSATGSARSSPRASCAWPSSTAWRATTPAPAPGWRRSAGSAARIARAGGGWPGRRTCWRWSWAAWPGPRGATPRRGPTSTARCGASTGAARGPCCAPRCAWPACWRSPAARPRGG